MPGLVYGIGQVWIELLNLSLKRAVFKDEIEMGASRKLGENLDEWMRKMDCSEDFSVS